MNCKEVEEQEILDGYLLDRLTEPQRDEFERHYFECASCFSQLQSRRVVQEELQRQPVMEARGSPAHLRRMGAWTPVFAALALVLAAGVWWYATRRVPSAQQAKSSAAPPVANPQAPRQSQQPSPLVSSLEQLARVEPPPYSAVVLRGPEDEAQQNFNKGMQHYLKGNFVGAIPGLRAAVKTSPQTARFSFYLGACYLLTSQSDSAIKSFQNVISLDDPSYSQAAHFYLAKAYLQIKNISSAQQELQMTVQLGGSRAAEAEEILRQLDK